MTKKIGNRLREIMANKYVTCTELAKQTGISRQAIRAIKNNRTKVIKVDTLEKIMNCLDASPNEFFEWRD